MFDWTDEFITQAQQSFPNLKYYIAQCFDMGDHEQCIEFLFALNYDNRRDV